MNANKYTISNLVIKLFLFLIIGCSAMIIVGIFRNILNIEIETRHKILLLLLLSATVLIGLIALFKSLFKLIDIVSVNKQKWITIGIFISMSVVLLVLINTYRIVPNGDSFDDIDTAYYLLSHVKAEPDIIHSYYLGIYGNNYLLIILLKFILKFFQIIGINDYLRGLYYLNLVAILLAHFLLYLTIKKWKNTRFANKIILLCAFNPVYYGLVFWVYSLTISLPFMIGGVLVALLISKANCVLKVVILSVVEGIIVFLGFKIRPTAVFPIIAIATCLIVYHQFTKRIVLSCLCIIIVVLSLHYGWKPICNSYFGDFSSKNLPISYWLAMGSHGNGTLATQDQNDLMTLENLDDEEKLIEGLKITAKYYINNGIVETLKLWYGKILTTWSDGYSGINERLCVGETGSDYFSYIAGDRSKFLYFYSQIYRLILLFGIITYCIRTIMTNKAQIKLDISIISILTILGGLLFYSLWEAKNVYSAPFIFFQIIVASNALQDFQESIIPFVTAKAKYDRKYLVISLIIYTSIIIITLFLMTNCLRDIYNYNNYYIQTFNNNRQITSINVDGNLTQDFTTANNFNRIQIKASYDGAADEVSDYLMTLTDENQQVIASQLIKPDMIENGTISFSIQDSLKSGRYKLCLEKVDFDNRSICCYRQESYYIDLYDGKLIYSYNGEVNSYVSDMIIDVFYENKTRKYSDAFIIHFIVMIGILFCIPMYQIVNSKIKNV